MANFAVMNGNVVTNIIVADSKEIAEQIVGSVIEYDETNTAAIGSTFSSTRILHLLNKQKTWTCLKTVHTFFHSGV